MGKRLIWGIWLLIWLTFAFGAAFGAAIPLEAEAPYPPRESALDRENLRYDDGSIRVEIETEIVHETKVFWVSVKISDPSQLRTAMAGAKGTKATAQPMAIAQRAGAVLAVNGDYFTSHNSGVIYRQGKRLRNVPAYTRDELLIDENGDLTILAFPARTGKAKISETIADFQTGHEIWQAFAFGPGLIIDGEPQEINYREKVSCDAMNRQQRIIFCQTGPLEYLFLVTEGKEQFEPGFTVQECAELLNARGGILQAYNLDGGNSAQIVLCGEKVNAAEYEKARNISDMICFVSLGGGEE